MLDRRFKSREDTKFWVMKRLEENPDVTQRELAKELGISLGGVNYCIKALMDKGFIRVQNFSHSKHKFGYVYLLTPVGILEKTSLAARFLKIKMREYEAIRAEIEMLKKEISKTNRTKE